MDEIHYQVLCGHWKVGNLITREPRRKYFEVNWFHIGCEGTCCLSGLSTIWSGPRNVLWARSVHSTKRFGLSSFNDSKEDSEWNRFKKFSKIHRKCREMRVYRKSDANPTIVMNYARGMFTGRDLGGSQTELQYLISNGVYIDPTRPKHFHMFAYRQEINYLRRKLEIREFELNQTTKFRVFTSNSIQSEVKFRNL